ncbi:hypothetical protein [Shigella dysenteriae]|nr:hypothetical protein [Shigella dysenteriae]
MSSVNIHYLSLPERVPCDRFLTLSVTDLWPSAGCDTATLNWH